MGVAPNHFVGAMPNPPPNHFNQAARKQRQIRRQQAAQQMKTGYFRLADFPGG